MVGPADVHGTLLLPTAPVTVAGRWLLVAFELRAGMRGWYIASGEALKGRVGSHCVPRLDGCNLQANQTTAGGKIEASFLCIHGVFFSAGQEDFGFLKAGAAPYSSER